MRRYETIFILRPDLGEAQFRENIKRFEGFVVSGGGEMLEIDEWGFRELAYRIHNERRGYYVRLDYAAGGDVMNEVERNLKLSDVVLRYLSVLVDPEVDVAKARTEIETRRHRAAEAKAAAEARAAAAAAAAEHPPVENREGGHPESAGAAEAVAAAESAEVPATGEPRETTAGGQAAGGSGSEEPSVQNGEEAAGETPQGSPSGEPKQD